MIREDLDLFQDLAREILRLENEQPVAKPIPSEELFEQLDLTLGELPMQRSDFESLLKDLIERTPKTSSKRFFNQLYGGRKSTSVLGDLLSVMLNTSMYTYKVAGPMVGVEKAILRKVCQMINYPESADGTIASGGSMTNLMAMLMARDRADHRVGTDGVQTKMLLYTSEASHYSIPKNAAFIGIGRDAVRLVDVDSEGRMMASALKAMIEEDMAKGCTPFMVNATAGTTVLGAFDPIREIHAVCREYDLWLHVDGAYCGAVIFSDKYRHLVDGVELTDSFSFNAHKMLNTTLTCSIIVTKDKTQLFESFSAEADYLYQTENDEYNLGKTSLQCGRRNDALKLWTMCKAIGTRGLGDMVDHQFDLAQVARDYIRSNPDYTLYSHDDTLSICFNYKNIPAEEICTKLYQESELMVGHGKFHDESFVRLVAVNAENEREDIIQFFKLFEAFAAGHF